METKRNPLPRLGAAVLVLTLATTALLSGTMAKYTSTVSGTDTARVAKFDYTVHQNEETVQLLETATPLDIFGTSADDTGVMGTDDTNEQKLVAPGMEGYFGFTFTNKSEVAVQATFDSLGYENENGLPLIYYFNGGYYSDLYDGAYGAYTFFRHEGDETGVILDGDMDDLLAALNGYQNMAAVAGEPGGVSREAASFLAPTDKVTYTQASVQLNWFWAYEARLTTDDPSSQPLLMDAYDTALGENGTYMVTMAPVVRMTQIDTYNTDGITADAAGAQTWADGYAPAYPDIPTVSG